jgi:hypothetical protein
VGGVYLIKIGPYVQGAPPWACVIRESISPPFQWDGTSRFSLVRFARSTAHRLFLYPFIIIRRAYTHTDTGIREVKNKVSLREAIWFGADMFWGDL